MPSPAADRHSLRVQVKIAPRRPRLGWLLPVAGGVVLLLGAAAGVLFSGVLLPPDRGVVKVIGPYRRVPAWFQCEPIEEETEYVERRTRLARLELRQDERSIQLSVREMDELEIAVLEVASGAIRKVWVEYRSLTRRTAVNGQVQQEGPTEVSGKRYAVWRAGNEIVVKRGDGLSDVTEEERVHVASDFAGVGFTSDLAGIPSRLLMPSERVPELEESARSYLEKVQQMDGKGDVIALESVRVHYEGRQGREAVFSVLTSMSVAMDEKDVSFTTELAGLIKVRKDDCWPTLVELSGPIASEGSRGRLHGVEVQGELRLLGEFEY